MLISFLRQCDGMGAAGAAVDPAIDNGIWEGSAIDRSRVYPVYGSVLGDLALVTFLVRCGATVRKTPRGPMRGRVRHSSSSMRVGYGTTTLLRLWVLGL